MIYSDRTVPETCILCLEDNLLALAQFIDVYSEKGLQLNVVKIINKYLPMQLAPASPSTSRVSKICSECWKTLSTFHTLYDFVSAAQVSLRETKVLTMDDEEDDPLTQGNFNEVTAADKNTADQTELSFYPEVKIEEHELEQLPKIEVLESMTNLDASPARRLRKRVKAEAETATELIRVNNEEAAPKKRRGRPRKTEIPKEIADELPVNKSVVIEADLKTEKPTDLSDQDDQEFNCNFDEGLEDQSNDSSEDSSESNEDDSDFEFKAEKPNEVAFAVIPKRTPVRPKKYKKRAKPTEPKVRMSRELLDQRKKQQEEYDGIIAKFFSDVLPCSICNLLVHNFTEMQRHHRLTHQVDPGYMICCGRKFTQRKVLAEHVLVHWNPEHFKCITCEKAFQNSRHLESHQQVHVAKVSFQCDLCSKVFLSKTAIDYHKLNKHVPKSEFKFTCADCGKK